MKNELSHIKCFLLDMDGTIHLSGHAIDGAVEAIERLRNRARVIFLTNNTSVGRMDYVTKLKKMGIEAQESDIYTAGNATIDYLKKTNQCDRIFLLGTEKLRSQFLSEGIKLVEDKTPKLVVIGFDTSLTYDNLALACDYIRQGIPYIATHPDINCPTLNGYIPDVGSFIALIKKSTGKSPQLICGKPNKPIADGIKNLTNLASSEIAMVGDRLSTDMKFAKNNGFYSVLVLSGEAKLEDLPEFNQKIDLVIASIAQL